MSLTISVLITNYNTWPMTLRCVQALERYSNANLTEVLVVDDGSQQPIPAYLPTIARVIQNSQNQGYVASVNIGFAHSQSDIIIMFDSDAYPLMDLTEPLIEVFTKNQKLGAVGFELVDEQGQPTGSSQPPPHAMSLLLGQKLEAWLQSWWFPHNQNDSSCLYSCGMAVRRAAFEAIGGFDEKFDFLDADIDFSIRLKIAGWQTQVKTTLKAFHQGGGSFQMTSTRVLRYHKNRWRLLAKHQRLPLPQLFKFGLAIRHTIEYSLLKICGKWLIKDPAILEDKLYGRQELLRQVWSGYGNQS